MVRRARIDSGTENNPNEDAWIIDSRFKGRPWHDIRSYGAAVDGSTDDTEAILDALNAAASDGGIVYIPRGTTRHDALTLDASFNGVTVAGSGYGSELKLIDNSSAGSSKRNINLDDSTNPLKNITIRNLRINGNRGTVGIEGGLLHFGQNNADRRLRFNQLWVHNCNETGIKMDGVGASLRGAVIWDNGRHGLTMDNDGTQKHPVPSAVGVRAFSNGLGGAGYGIDMSSGRALLSHFVSHDNLDGLKTSTGSRSQIIANGVVSQNDNQGVEHTGSGDSAMLVNLRIERNGGNGIRFAGGSTFYVSNILASDNNVDNLADGNVNISDSGTTIYLSGVLEASDPTNGDGINHNDGSLIGGTVVANGASDDGLKISAGLVDVDYIFADNNDTGVRVLSGAAGRARSVNATGNTSNETAVGGTLEDLGGAYSAV